MSATNVVAAGVEELGCRTFSAKEMAFNILGLMHPLMFDVTQVEPVWADFNGGMSAIADLHILNAKIRDDINKTASTRRAIAMDNSADFKVSSGSDAEAVQQKVNIAPRANFTLPFPKLAENFDAQSDLTKIRGLIDLDKVIVVTGYAEVGPFGSSRTRWEMEAKGEFSIEGLLELAFTLGLIKHFNGRLKSGQTYVGWVDAKSEEPVDDKDIRGKYEKHILQHTGVRLIGKSYCWIFKSVG
jgi:fatty acid synthase subunit alpha